MPLREKEQRKLFLTRKIIDKMETNSKTKVYKVTIYKDNSVKTSELDGDGISNTVKRKVYVSLDSKGNVGLTAFGDTEEEALTTVKSEFERDRNEALNSIEKIEHLNKVINDKLNGDK